ncbi:DNA polymerase Y family protein [soil metagenome]
MFSMRVACLDLPAFPLQLVWRAEPSWRSNPVVVIDEDRPQGIVLWACERARGAGVMIGQRYAHALSLCAGLRARVVPPEQIQAATGELRTALHLMSPSVESGEPGTCWLDGAGLGNVFPDPQAWGMHIGKAAAVLGYHGAVVVGFSRFATYAIARAVRHGLTVIASDVEERRSAAAVPLARLEIDPTLRDALARLGVTTIGQMIRLPGGGILERFGREAHLLYQLAAGERWDPLVPVPPPEAPDERVLLYDEDDNFDRLVFVVNAPIQRLLARLAAKGRAVQALRLELTLKYGVGRVEIRSDCLVPAEATLDAALLVRLIRLRLQGQPPIAPVNALRVWADDVPASQQQLALFASKPRRDLRAADEALAKLRAELGNDAVLRATLRDGHLPEARFAWERLTQLVKAAPKPRGVRRLMRRMLAHPQPLPLQSRHVRDDGWLLSGLEHGAVMRLIGPFVISGGWWGHENGVGTHREYHYAELRRGGCLWVFYDRKRRRWFRHGSVE